MTATISVNLNVPLDELCSKYAAGRNNFFDKISNTPVDFDPVLEFENEPEFDEGGFGIVKIVQYPLPNGPSPIALKMVGSYQPEDSIMVAKELAALEGLRDSIYIPKFYGCSIQDVPAARDMRGRNEPAHQSVYMAQELLSHKLSSPTFKNHISLVPKAETLTLFSQIFKGLRDLNSKGLAHNDIKPEHLMTNDDMSRVYLIDFCSVSSIDDKIAPEGTLTYMTPKKFTGDHNSVYESKDDMYSAAVSIINTLSEIEDEVFFTPGVLRLDNACVRNHSFFLTTECRSKMLANVKSLLNNAGYGSYASDSSKDAINFTTLISDMVEYDHFQFTVDEVVQIMDRLVEASRFDDLHQTDQNEERKDGGNVQRVLLNNETGHEEVSLKKLQEEKMEDMERQSEEKSNGRLISI